MTLCWFWKWFIQNLVFWTTTRITSQKLTFVIISKLGYMWFPSGFEANIEIPNCFQVEHPPQHVPFSVCPSVCPSIRRAPYLRNHTSSDNHFLYTCVKWWYLQVLFSFFLYFYFSGCYEDKWVNRIIFFLK